MSKRSTFAAAVEADATLSEKSPKSKELAATIMEKYDRNQDGEFNLGEVVDIIEDLQSEKSMKKRAFKLAGGLSFVVLALLAVNSAPTAAVVALSKEVKVEDIKTGADASGRRMLSSTGGGTPPPSGAAEGEYKTEAGKGACTISTRTSR